MALMDTIENKYNSKLEGVYALKITPLVATQNLSGIL